MTSFQRESVFTKSLPKRDTFESLHSRNKENKTGSNIYRLSYLGLLKIDTEILKFQEATNFLSNVISACNVIFWPHNNFFDKLM